jgi:hypothetical protein
MKRSLSMAVFLNLLLAVTPMFAQVQKEVFHLKPSPSVLGCISAGNGTTPSAEVTVFRGKQNDFLVLRAHHLKPNLAFDVFTVQNSNLLPNGLPDANFKNFGLAWYQSDLQADGRGEAEVTIKTILLDQIFGFDPAVGLPPTNTFHLGFWFNNPKKAAACGFDPTKPTPFNGEHKAGPVAMISVPNATTHLGPLCTNPRQVGSQFVCHP